MTIYTGFTKRTSETLDSYITETLDKSDADPLRFSVLAEKAYRLGIRHGQKIASGSAQCAKHPKYKAVRKPAVPCPMCWAIYLTTLVDEAMPGRAETDK